MTSESSEYPQPRARILLVEDNPIFAMELSARLIELGHEVCGIANNAIDALVIARRTVPDLALVDIVLQGHIDGIQTARMLGSLGIPVVYVTAYSDAQTLERAAIASPHGIVRKPLRGDEFERTVTSALHNARLRQ